MKTLVFKGLGLALLISLMMQCGPLLCGMMCSMLGRFEVLADSIIDYDTDGNLQLNGQAAENLLADLGEKSEHVTAIIGNTAQDILNITANETESPEDALAEYEELKTKAMDWLNEINEIGGLFIN